MKVLSSLRSSGMGACLLAAAVTLFSTVAKSPVMLGIGWVCVIVAGVYAARHSPDAKRARALQVHAHAQRAKAAGETP